MTPREVDLIRVRLADISDTALALARNAEDLYRLAYEKGSARADVKVAGGDVRPELDSHGDPRARHLWHTLEKKTKAAEIGLRAVRHGIDNLMSEGQIDDTPRFGSSMTPGQFDKLRANQTDRAARGEYTPHRTEEQPDHGARIAEREKRRKGKRR